MASGLMGGLMAGMAFGAGAEMMRGLLGGGALGNGIANNFFPMLAGAGSGFLSYKFLFALSPYRIPLSIATGGGLFMLTKGGPQEEYPME